MKLTPTQIKAVAQEVADQVKTLHKKRYDELNAQLKNCAKFKALCKMQTKLAQEYKKIRALAKEVEVMHTNKQATAVVRAQFDYDGSCREPEAYVQCNKNAYHIEDQVKHKLTLQSINGADVDVAALITNLVKEYAA